MASSVTMDAHGKALMDLNSALEVSDTMKHQRGQNERKSQQILPLNKKIIKPMSSHKNMGNPSSKQNATLMVSGGDQLLFASDQVLMADSQNINTSE